MMATLTDVACPDVSAGHECNGVGSTALLIVQAGALSHTNLAGLFINSVCSLASTGSYQPLRWR